MAAEVPVSDVLCEAMEYLSKLGSNLRTRSENLKEKRISKEKLKNSHAVQKAASKVLLICELSKKSLDNVEAGVRQVLSMLEASQAPIGGKNSHRHNRKSKDKYHYFEYRSRKLRIATKIHLKHFMSVKVLAKEMAPSMAERYPVYYDCKLKRQRRRLAEKNETIIDSKSRSDSDHTNEKPTCTDNNQVREDGNNLIEGPCEILEGNHNNISKDEQPLSAAASKDSQCHNRHENLVKEKLSNQSDMDSNKKYKDHSNSSSLKTSCRNSKDTDSDINEKEGNTDSPHKLKHDKHKKKLAYITDTEVTAKKIPNRVRFADVYSSDSNEASNSRSKEVVANNTTPPPNIENNNDTASDSSSHEPKAKKVKYTENDDTNLDSDIGEKESKLGEKTHDKDLPKNDSDNDSQQSNICGSSQTESGSESRPLIRCVNLSKLLKPGIVSNDKQKTSVSKNDKTLMKKERSLKKKVHIEKENDEEYWAQKRKEVSKFKPKKFYINVERLPQLSVNFLISNKLKKITKNGNIVCEVQNEIDTPNTKKIKAVKSALLNDSETDECAAEISDAMRVKKSLLKDSDSEQNMSDKEESKEVSNNDESLVQKVIADIESLQEAITNNFESNPNKNKSKSDRTDISEKGDSSKGTEDNNDVTPKENITVCQEGESNKNSNENATDTPSITNEAVKCSLLNDSSDEEFAGFGSNDSGGNKINETSDKSNDQNNTDNGQSTVPINENTPVISTEIDETAKGEGPLNSSSDDPFSGFNQENMETLTKTNDKMKSALLNDSSDENKQKEESPTKVNEKVKSALLNDSSDVKSDESDDQRQRERQKTPKSKRKQARRCREAKKKINYSSSSDSEQEKSRNKRSRKKSHGTNSSSSSSEDIKRKTKKKKLLKIDSDSNDADKRKRDEDENLNSKMVRSKAKPSGSSSQNSENQDASDKDIDGLTNLNNLTKTRRREASARNREDSNSSSLPKAAPILGEELLKAETSSEVSEGEDNAMYPDLPEVTLPGLNGDHMAKDDLLGETDSSISHHDKEQSENPDNSDEEEGMKLKRRKAPAISSDSESGSNRRKLKDDKMSDFEDTEDESSEAGKRTKRKKKAIDSDASCDSKEEGQKKRRRIKVVHDSEGSGSDTENEGRNKHGRKNIRKVMGKNQLEEATKKAAREEKERIARITERQKLYNNLDFDESGKPDEVVLEKVVLDFDPETKEPLIQVDRGLVKKLKPHQANGIKFMWDACFESVKRIKKDKGSGCILAHCMGLGKTLQVISLTHTLLIHGKLTGVNRVLVVCPLSTVLNWVNEFRMWLKHAETEYEVDVYELSRYKQNSERAYQLQQWFEGGGVCVLGYEMFRNLSADNNKKFKKKMLKSFQESLVEPGPDLVVCDEGHLLKNEKTSLSQSMNKVKTLRRIVLTGTPLQNNLKEYYCMVQFVKPNLLGKYNEYLNRFVNPITNGQYTDSTEHDIRVMKRRSHVLHKMLDGAVQRRDYGVLAPFLPPKHEYVLFITLTDVQVKLYQHYLDNYSRRPLPGKSSGFLFPDFQSLQRIWTHPLVLKYNSERYEIMQQKKREREEEDSEGSLVDFIDDDSTPDESSTEESSDDLSDMSDDSRKKSKKKKSCKKGKGKESKASTRRGTRANPVEIEEDGAGVEEVLEVKNENPTEWWIKLVDEAELEDMTNSHKLVLLFDILRQCEAIGDKLLVFSQSLYSLDLIEHFLGKVDEATQEGRIDEKLGGHVGSWSPGVDYFRLDGSTSCENRSIWCKNFNREDNPRARLFLISTRAGGLGINLVAANRVVIFDVSWNPSHDVQSIFRVYRFGQKKPCYVYRFLAMGTMEEKIYERQVTKQAISKRVIDEQQIDRHYAENDLAELYKFEARPTEPRPLPTLPKDRLFAEMLKEHEAQIYKYHEHDSLLENKEEETLSEEERKAAWEDFENEKNKPPPSPFPSAWPMHNGMMPGLLAQQQQQLAYAALAAMLRKDMPNINDNQIRDMLPLIYNSNPGLMQKMGEIYKYAQPGMMNPGMMNPVMNAGSGGAGAGGASGLQYEPPWQRQHQQQQQLRLQQLMQQQNQMGAKFYAGGLGSRDPIAMALQQQRAREMLMGGAPSGGRPRGRPPLQPRHPTTTSQDIVNLDSD